MVNMPLISTKQRETIAFAAISQLLLLATREMHGYVAKHTKVGFLQDTMIIMFAIVRSRESS